MADQNAHGWVIVKQILQNYIDNGHYEDAYDYLIEELYSPGTIMKHPEFESMCPGCDGKFDNPSNRRKHISRRSCKKLKKQKR